MIISAGQTVLLTGASGGLGNYFADALAEYKVKLALVAYPGTGLEALSQRLKQRGVSSAFLAADLRDPAQRLAVLDFVHKEFGEIDLLVNNAGVAPEKRVDILEATEESFDRLISINTKGPYFLTQSIARWMVEQKSGQIVTISSVSAYTASVSRGDYCVSKAGLSMMTKLFATRLAEFGIGVYEIRPGIIATDMTAGVKEKYDALIAKGLSPIARWGTPEDIGKAVVAIATRAFPFSTGEVFNVDGGFHLRTL